MKKTILPLFLDLVSRTCPHGYEDEYMDYIREKTLDIPFKKDTHGNYKVVVGDSTRSMFTCHIDTVSRIYKPTKTFFDGKFVKTDTKTTLGADCKAGMAIMINMIRNGVPGHYYFFIGEECGGIGSSALANSQEFDPLDYDRVISFDRRGTSSVITHQSGRQCCSFEFSEDLCSRLNDLGMSYQNDNGGTYTDSYEFMDLVPECTNISVGYYNEHRGNEYQDVAHLNKLAHVCTLIDWESLPTKRNPNLDVFGDYYYTNF